jgi:hypothetical protein
VVWADGAASVAIGLLLIANSLVIAEATRSLVGGETVVPPVLTDIERAVKALTEQLEISEIKTLHLGARTILVAFTIAKVHGRTVVQTQHDLQALTERVRAVDQRIAFVYFRFD